MELPWRSPWGWTTRGSGASVSLPVADVYEFAFDLPGYVSLAAALAVLLLLPLYLSQRRDVQRLRAWMEREPERPGADLAASEALLDRAEAELEAVFGQQQAPSATGVEAHPTMEPTGVAPPTPVPRPPPATAAPVQGAPAERPALDRITMERAALEPHPRWRRLVARVGQPRVLSTIALLAVVLGLAAI